MGGGGGEESHSDQYLLDQQFESTDPGVATTHIIHMTNLPYIYAEMNTETRDAWEVWMCYNQSGPK
jgi:hypothetical protein